MDWTKWLAIGLLTMYAIGLPLVLVRALRRKDWQRLFELIPTSIVFVNVTLDLALPNLSHPWFVRWLLYVMSTLFVANWFGFSRWLFGRSRTSAT